MESENVLLMKIPGNASRERILRIAQDVVAGHKMGQTVCYMSTKYELSKKL